MWGKSNIHGSSMWGKSNIWLPTTYCVHLDHFSFFSPQVHTNISKWLDFGFSFSLLLLRGRKGEVKYIKLKVWWLLYRLLSGFSYQQFAINIIFRINILILLPSLRKAKSFVKENKFVQYKFWATRQKGY